MVFEQKVLSCAQETVCRFDIELQQQNREVGEEELYQFENCFLFSASHTSVVSHDQDLFQLVRYLFDCL